MPFSIDQFRAAKFAPILADAKVQMFTVPNRFTADQSGWKLGDVINQTGDTFARVATITIPNDLPIGYYDVIFYDNSGGSAQAVGPINYASDLAGAISSAINGNGLPVTATSADNVVTLTSTTTGLLPASGGYNGDGTWFLEPYVNSLSVLDAPSQEGADAIARVATLTVPSGLTAGFYGGRFVDEFDNAVSVTGDYADANALASNIEYAVPGSTYVMATRTDNVVELVSSTPGALPQGWGFHDYISSLSSMSVVQEGANPVTRIATITLPLTFAADTYEGVFYDDDSGSAAFSAAFAANDYGGLAAAIAYAISNEAGFRATATSTDNVVTITATDPGLLLSGGFNADGTWYLEETNMPASVVLAVTQNEAAALPRIAEITIPTDLPAFNFYELYFVDETNMPWYTGGACAYYSDLATAIQTSLDTLAPVTVSINDNVVTLTSQYPGELATAWQLREPQPCGITLDSPSVEGVDALPRIQTITVPTVHPDGYFPSGYYTISLYNESGIPAGITNSYASDAYSLANSLWTAIDYAFYNTGFTISASVADGVVTLVSTTPGALAQPWSLYEALPSNAVLDITQADQDGLPPSTFVVTDVNNLGNAGGYESIGNTVNFLNDYGAPANTIGEAGNGYVDLNTGDFYQRTEENGWQLVMNIKGPPGTNGANGTNGAAGAAGAAGASAPGALTTLDKTRAVTTWTSRNASSFANWDAVVWAPEIGRFCAISAGSAITSPDGITWTAVVTVGNNIERITWSPALGLFCVVGSGPTIRVATSPDGVTWTTRTAAEANDFYGVTWSPELGIFCAVAASGTNRVMTSPDGITWTARAATEANQWWSICWSPELGIFCALSLSGTNRVMTSPDGITWTARTAAQANTWRAVCWSSELGLFCAVADVGTNRVMTSPDGITWTARSATEANNWMAIAWSSELGLFCAVAASGTNRVMTSPDGITWTARSAAAANGWSGIAWSPELGIFCALSTSGTPSDGTGQVMHSRFPQKWDASGRYTPTLTHVTNVSASTTALCQWFREGRMVTVSGRISIDPTTTLVASEIDVSLPVPSDFLTIGDCGGQFSGTAVKEGGGIVADVTNNRAQFLWVPTDVTNQPYAFQFSYYVY